ncbi:hypothetical protein BDW69DRAFT_160749 [Aspergillus filifer]
MHPPRPLYSGKHPRSHLQNRHPRLRLSPAEEVVEGQAMLPEQAQSSPLVVEPSYSSTRARTAP